MHGYSSRIEREVRGESKQALPFSFSQIGILNEHLLEGVGGNFNYEMVLCSCNNYIKNFFLHFCPARVSKYPFSFQARGAAASGNWGKSHFGVRRRRRIEGANLTEINTLSMSIKLRSNMYYVLVLLR